MFESAVITLEDYFQELRSTIASPLYFNRVAKLCFERLFTLYFDFFLNACQICFNCCLGFYSEDVVRIFDKFQSFNEKNQEHDKKAKKKEKDKQKNLQQQNFMIVFNNKENLIEKIKKEKNFFVEANEKYLNIIGKNSIEKLDKMFKIFLDLLKMSRSDIESSFSNINDSFQAKGIYIVESVLFIREDVDAEFKKEILRKYQEYSNKQQNK